MDAVAGRDRERLLRRDRRKLGGNVWAVGSATTGGDAKALTMHWDGKRWTIVPGNTPDGDVALLGVLATWTHNIWAVGTTDYGSTLIVHWNGAPWS